MPAVSSPTMTAAVQGLVARANQSVLDGTIAGVYADGQLVVTSEDISFLAPTVLDHLFQPAEPVILARSDAEEWVVVSVGATLPGTTQAPGSGPSPLGSTRESEAPAPPPGAGGGAPTGPTSLTLHDALLRYVIIRSQILKKGSVIGVLEDGQLVVRLRAGDYYGRAATTQAFGLGQTIYAIIKDDGKWLVLGSSGVFGDAQLPPPEAADEPVPSPVVVDRETVTMLEIVSARWPASIAVTVAPLSGSGAPLGVVRVYVDGALDSEGALVSGTATIVLAADSGERAISAAFVPDPGWLGSTASATVTIFDGFTMVGNQLGDLGFNTIEAYTSRDGLAWRAHETPVMSAESIVTPLAVLQAFGSPPNGPTTYGCYAPVFLGPNDMLIAGWLTADDPNDFTSAIIGGADPATIYGPDKIFRSLYSSGAWQTPTLNFRKIGYTINDPSLVTVGGALLCYHTALPNASAYPVIVFNQHTVAVMKSVDGGTTWTDWQIVIPAASAGDGQGAWAPSAVYDWNGVLWVYYHTGTSTFSGSMTWRQRMSADGLSMVGAPERCSFVGGSGLVVNMDVARRAASDTAYRLYYGSGTVGAAEDILSVDVVI